MVPAVSGPITAETGALASAADAPSSADGGRAQVPSVDPARSPGRMLRPGPGTSNDRPLLTWYHAAAGQRVELSARTFGNWVAKTANLLVEELGLEPGDRVGLLLPSHWQAPVALAACWRAGVSAVPAGPDGPAAALLAEAGCAACFVHEELLAEAPRRFAGEPPPLLVVTADPLGRAAGDLGGALPYARLAASMPDHFDGGEPAAATEALLLAGPDGPRRWTQGQLVETALELGEQMGVREGDRLYCGLGLDSADGVLAGVAVPLVRGAGVVLERDPDPAGLAKRLADERVTVAALTSEQAAAVRSAPDHDRDLQLAEAPLTGGSSSRF
jgi:uncharacterized protein (TIGR03089 family)